MAKRAPTLTQEERARIRRQAAEANRAVREAAEAAITREAKAWLVAHGALVPDDGVGNNLVRLDRWRKAHGYGVGVQASAPAYRPTLQQQHDKPLAGIVEVEF